MYCLPGFTDAEDVVGNIINGSCREEPLPSALESIQNLAGNRHSLTTSTVKNMFTEYFSSPREEVSWQYQHVHRST